MLVQALAAYADTYLAGELEDPAFEEKPVPYAIEVFDDGSFAGIRERVQEVSRGKDGKKTSRMTLPLRVPKSPINRTSEVAPLLGCDSLQYLLGPGVWTPPRMEENNLVRQAAFAELLRRAAQETGDAALRACASFCSNPEQVRVAREQMAELKPKNGALTTLAVIPRDPAAGHPGGPIVLRPVVRDWWRRQYTSAFGHRVAQGGEGMCLISGRVGPIAPTHNPIVGTVAIGGQPFGVRLMSFDKPAFRSYGWEKNANSPVSPERAAAYVLALNDLLRIGTHRQGASRDHLVSTRYDAGGVAFLYWTRLPNDDDVMALIRDPQPDEVAALLKAPTTGNADVGIRANDFYLIAVSGNGARLQIRHWFHDTIAIVHANVRRWFAGLRIANVFDGGATSSPAKLWELQLAISDAKKGTPIERAAALPASRSVQLVRRALEGIPLGPMTLAAALGRLRADQGSARLAPARIGLIRLCVNDSRIISSDQGPIMDESLNEGLENPAYLCGRLLAVFDGLQYAAQGELNTTVADRYFALASTSPLVAFPKIRDLAQHHLKKLRRDNRPAAVSISRQVDELYDRLARNGASFPGQLSLEDQGRFAIGFHHQKAEATRRMQAAKGARRVTDGSTIAEPPPVAP